MPLTPGSTPTTIGHNIREMIASGRPQKVAVAASLHTADKAKKGQPTKRQPHNKRMP